LEEIICRPRGREFKDEEKSRKNNGILKWLGENEGTIENICMRNITKV